MNAKNYINTSYPYLKPSDTVANALDLMKDFKVYHLPLIDEENDYLSLFSESFLENFDEDKLLKDIINPNRPFVYEDQNLFDILLKFNDGNLSLLPVIERDSQKYLGPIAIFDLVNYAVRDLGLDRDGGIIILTINAINYSPTQIASIVESNNATIISMFTVPEGDKVKVIIKVNQKDIFHLLEAFERYGYEIENVQYDDQRYYDYYKDIYDALLKYLSI